MALGRAAQLVARWRGRQPAPPPPTPAPVRVETDVGSLLIQPHDLLMLPMITETGRWEVEESDQLRPFSRQG